jgi:hypothetical protein
MLADSMTAARLINGNLGAFRLNGQLAATLYQSPRARKSRVEAQWIDSFAPQH